MDVHWTYCDDHFTIYTNIKSLYHKSETDKILLVNYTSIKKNIMTTKKKNMCLRIVLDPNTFISNQQLAWYTVHNRHFLDEGQNLFPLN